MPDLPVPEPLILVVDADPSERVVRALRRRYAADYEIMLARGGAQALLETLSTGGRRVALLLASEDDGDGPVDALFSQTASLFPEARRALLIEQRKTVV